MPVAKIRDRTCQQCGKCYVLGVDSSQHKYCSIECRKKFHNSVWSSKYGGRNKESTRAWRLRKQYGLSVEDWNQMLVNQGNCCAICCTKEKPHYNWHVDHNHKTGKVRGLLCNRCNQAIGLAKENLIILHKMMEYLVDHDN